MINHLSNVLFLFLSHDSHPSDDIFNRNLLQQNWNHGALLLLSKQENNHMGEKDESPIKLMLNVE
jgi:hypothetical protein